MRTIQVLAPFLALVAAFGLLALCGQPAVALAPSSEPGSVATPSPTITSTPAISPTRTATETETPVAQKGGVWVNYTAENPLVNALVVEGDYVWTGTNGDGVVRWSRADGSFVRYTTADGLVHNTVRAVAVDLAGHKWFGTERGVSEFDGRTWTTYTTTHGLAADKVVGIAVDPAGRKWFATWGGGVSEFDGQKWTTHTRAGGLPSNNVHTVAVDRRGHVWVGTPNGVGEFDGRRWRTYTTADGLIDAWVHAIAVDEAGHIWFGAPGGVSEYDGQAWRTFSAADGLLSDHVHAIAADSAGRVWFATPAGVSSFDGRQWTGYAAASGLPHSRATAIAVDGAGHPWLGAVDGLMGFDGRAWRMYTTGSLAGNQVNAIVEDEAGHKWFATDRLVGIVVDPFGRRSFVTWGGGVSEFDGHTWRTYTSADGLASDHVNAIALDEAGRKWFGTDAGVSEYDGRTWTTYAITQGLAGNQVRAIAFDEAGNKWFATDKGASRFDGRTWVTYAISQGLASDDVRAIAVDGIGHMWFDTAGGINEFDGLVWTTYSITKGRELYPYSLPRDGEGNQWTSGDGVNKFDGQTQTHYSYDDGLVSNSITTIAIDHSGHKWFGSNRLGVSEFIEGGVSPAVAAPPATAAVFIPPQPAAAPTPAPITSDLKTGPLPVVIAQIPLALPEEPRGGGDRLLLDAAAKRLYFFDTRYGVDIIDSAAFTMVAAIPVDTGRQKIVLDAPDRRLYVYSEYGSEPVTVIDTALLTVTGIVSPGGHVTLDPRRNRLYIGSQVYDGVTLKRLGEVPWRERYDYNPLRDEFLLGNGYAVDSETQRSTRDWLPDFTTQACFDCAGSRMVAALPVPERNLIVLESIVNAPGHGGMNVPPRYFDATTLDELTDLTGIPVVERVCGYQISLADPVNGRAYREDVIRWYSSYSTLLVYGPDGELETSREGLYLGVTDPAAGQMYLDGRVFDLGTLSPVGTFPAGCIFAVDAAAGRVYAQRGGDLVALAERGGRQEPLPPELPGLLPEGGISTIRVSPGYAADHALFLRVGNGIYRSADSGQTWARLRGGLPENQVGLFLDFEISPNFAKDRTLFAWGAEGTWQGEGVYRSTDGGDTWQPMWNNLIHLRVHNVFLSPGYAVDGTLLAYADSAACGVFSANKSVSRSTDRGLNWTLVITGHDACSVGQMSPALPPPEDLFPSGSSSTVRFRAAQYGIERTIDGGRTWQALTINRRPEFSAMIILPSPNLAADHTIYVLSSSEVYRSTDDGASWNRWDDARLAGRDYGNRLTASAVSPQLKDGSYRLFIGTAAGELWSLDPAALRWLPVPVEAQWPTVLAGESIGGIAAAPNGDVWLGTLGNGLVRYAGSAIRARYTITDGLPSPFVRNVAVTPDGTPWVGVGGQSVASFDGRAWVSHDLEKLVNNYVVGLAVGLKGDVWAGEEMGGLLHWDGHTWEKIIDPERPAGFRTYGIAVAPDGTIWLATVDGAAWYKDGTWLGHGLDKQYQVVTGPEGAIYFHNGDGVIRRNLNGQWTDLPTPVRGASPASGFHVAADGAVWFGTFEGAFRYDGRRWRQFTAQDGLPNNKVSAIAEDAGGWLWFGTENGAARVDPATLNLSPVVWQ